MMADVQGVSLNEPVERCPTSATGTGRVWYGPKVANINDKFGKWRSLGEYLLHKMSNDSAHEVIITDFASGRQYTGLQLREKVLAVACALVDGFNFEPGTMVCLSYDNSDHLLILTLAILVAGGAICCAYQKDPYAELLYMARKVEPKFLFCHAKNIHWSEQLSADLAYHVVGVPMDDPSLTDGKSQHKPNGARLFRCFDDLISYDYKTQSKSLDRLPVATVEPLDKQVAMIIMSSGTTGKPKAVALSHWNCIVDLLKSISRYSNVSFPCCASLDYVSGRIIMLGAIKSGYNAVILNGFEPKSYLETVEKYKAQVIYLGVASFYNLITYKHLDQYDISSVRVVFPMGARVTYLDALREFFTKHPNIVRVRQGFGTSEVSGVCLNDMTPEEYLRDSDNCGRLLPGLQAKVVDPHTGRLLGPNEPGILHVRGTTVFPGYFDKQKKRELKTRLDHKAQEMNGNVIENLSDADSYFSDASVFDNEGYYITGDLAYFDDKEELRVVGRLKELMSCRGAKKVLPQELEDIISMHPAVSKVCVLGIESRLEPSLHCPRAFVVVKQEYYETDNVESESEKNLSLLDKHKLCSLATVRRRSIAKDLMDFVNGQVGWEKQLTGGIVILDDIPTSRDTGKMNKNYLRSLDLETVEIFGDKSS